MTEEKATAAELENGKAETAEFLQEELTLGSATCFQKTGSGTGFSVLS